MSELTQSVVVCNLDGRILLYNNRARLQFRALSDAPAVAGGGELIGLGRSRIKDRKFNAPTGSITGITALFASCQTRISFRKITCSGGTIARRPKTGRSWPDLGLLA